EAFVAKETQLRRLSREMPLSNVAADSLRDEKLQLESSIANDELMAFRAKYLDHEPEGRTIEELLLNDDAEYMSMEKELRAVMASSSAEPGLVESLKAELNARAHAKAKAVNAAERGDYLDPAPLGVLLEKLPLDTDQRFSELEADRARAQRSPTENQKKVSALEEALNSRARVLASEALHGDRSYLDAFPAGVPLQMLSLDTDPKISRAGA
ncbi:calpain-like cysteine peptidase, partial [Trypanosoma conorhini]